jgi:riboflavin transporter FmnP
MNMVDWVRIPNRQLQSGWKKIGCIFLYAIKPPNEEFGGYYFEKVVFMKTQNPRLRKMTVTAMLAAVSFVLMLIQFPIPIFPSFLQFDFAELPALIGAFSFGPVAGVCIVLLKNMLHLTVTSTGGVGELSNFLVWSFLVLPAGLVYRYKKSIGGALLGTVLGVFAASAAGVFVNYYITIPFYINVMGLSEEIIIGICSAIIPAVDSLWKVVLISITPFNLFKGVLISLATFLTYKRLSWLIHGRYIKQ